MRDKRMDNDHRFTGSVGFRDPLHIMSFPGTEILLQDVSFGACGSLQRCGEVGPIATA
jgi:hypothetical protein